MIEKPELMAGVAIAIAVDADGPLAGALIIGAPGAGKSRIALALLETCPWSRSRLVADDAIHLHLLNASLIARPPEAIAGLMEIRGLAYAGKELAGGKANRRV